MLTGLNYTKGLIVYLIIKVRQLIQISMDLWEVDLNLDLSYLARILLFLCSFWLIKTIVLMQYAYVLKRHFF